MREGNINSDLVYIDEYDLLGSNFYWQKGIEMGMAKEDLAKVGLVNERVLIHKDIIRPLNRADGALHIKGYNLYITEGYRSKELYELINEKIEAKIGKHETGRILNMKDMPHMTGKSIDVALWRDGKKLVLHNKEDGINGYFVNFYKQGEKKNTQLQELQDFLINIMQDCGFRLGTKREYFHFNYDPNSPRNY